MQEVNWKRVVKISAGFLFLLLGTFGIGSRAQKEVFGPILLIPIGFALLSVGLAFLVSGFDVNLKNRKVAGIVLICVLLLAFAVFLLAKDQFREIF